MQTGAAIALVSDAGTPLISDPGLQARAGGAGSADMPSRPCRARRRCWRRLRLPDCRPTGFSSRDFCRQSRLRGANASRRWRAFRQRSFCSRAGPRLAAALADLAETMGEREAAICRELTKLHEEVRRGTVARACGALRRRRRDARRIRRRDRAAGRRRDVRKRRGHRRVCCGKRWAKRRSRMRWRPSPMRPAQPRRDIYRRALELVKDDDEAHD